MPGLNPFVGYGGDSRSKYFGRDEVEDEDEVDDDGDFFGGKNPARLDEDAVREGYDSYAIYNTETGKTSGRYISRTPAGAAAKAARRIFKAMNLTAPPKKTATKKTTTKKTATKKGKKGGYEEMLNVGDAFGLSGGGKKTKKVEKVIADDEDEEEEVVETTNFVDKKDLFHPGSNDINFFLKKTTRGADSGSLFYHFTASLRFYKVPIEITRGGVEVVINYKIFTSQLELPEDLKERQKLMKLKRKLTNDPDFKQKLADKKVAEKEAKAAKKAKEAEKKAAKKEKEAEKKAAKKEKEAEKKAAKKEKEAEKKAAKKAVEKKVAKKAAKKSDVSKKTKKTKKTTGGACGSCSMFY
jgi:hypothetical protein